jgi:hypothetical protein
MKSMLMEKLSYKLQNASKELPRRSAADEDSKDESGLLRDMEYRNLGFAYRRSAALQTATRRD